ncbi:uncharacterized protein LOC131327651 [Rhododendron vialii]|uniref:uncharacterized protein LOC131327651 n=1 Tax=Rhododendron vialii TaxID=182163 RepID=UPI00265F1908|nr:uncharacterized protein LOC131327651 [Rhododendron vialii]
MVQTPHTNALVVTFQNGVHDVKQVLVDQGSSIEVMYNDLFKKLDLPMSVLQPVEVPLICFNRAPIKSLGHIFLPIVVGSKMLSVKFVVVNISSPYNAILGRTWLHGMQAIASTYYQVVRFIGTHRRQKDLRGDQVASKKCYVSAVHNSTKGKQVQWVEVPDLAVLEDVGELAKEKAIEDLVSMPITEDRFWVDPNFISQSLNVNKDSKPIVQKARRSAPEHAEVVIEEVNRLLEANAIQEVQYPTWLSNTIIVKKNDKWRVCIDYTNLNDASPIDWFPLSKSTNW